MLPLTSQTPKPALPWAPERSLFDGAVALLLEAGADKITCNTHHLAQQMASHARECPLSPVDVRVEPTLRGPAGSLRTFQDVLPEHDAALIVSGDITYDGSLRALVANHVESEALLTIGVTRVADGSRFGVFEIDARGAISSYVEKSLAYRGRPALVSAGIYAADPRLVDLLDADRPNDFLADVLPRMKVNAELRLHRLPGSWSDLGTPEDYRSALLARVRQHGRPSGVNGAHVWQGEGAYVSPRAILYGDVFVGAEAVISDDAEVRDSAILRGAVVHWRVVATSPAATLNTRASGAVA